MNQALSEAHTVQPQALDLMFSRDNGVGNKDQSAAGSCNLYTNPDRHNALLHFQNRLLNFRNSFFFQTAIITMSQLVETK
jgi:hypothetical protein